MDETKLLAQVASVICAETCGLTSECKSREAAAALLEQGFLFRGITDAALEAATLKASDLGVSISQDNLRRILDAAFRASTN
jgi:hypothetical protein